MVVSGAPIRNGKKHATQIAQMSIDYLNSTRQYPIPHIPEENLQLRIGMHTGSCVAGITGTKTPRYLLFGNAVNTANIIEALGKPMRVHVSQTTAAILIEENYFRLESCGQCDVKGYGIMQTYWLEVNIF